MLINPSGKKTTKTKSAFGLTPSGPLAPAGRDSDGQTLNVTKPKRCCECCLELEETRPEACKIPVKQKEQSWKWKLRIGLFLSTSYVGFCLHDSFMSSRRAGTERRLPSLRVVPEPQGYS